MPVETHVCESRKFLDVSRIKVESRETDMQAAAIERTVNIARADRPGFEDGDFDSEYRPLLQLRGVEYNFIVQTLFAR